MSRQEVVAELQALLAELELDLQLCTTRDQHIRMSQRWARTSLLLTQLQADAQQYPAAAAA